MEVDTLTHEFPYVYHMAEEGSWPSIKRYGLLSTSALLDLYEIDGPERVQIESRRRPESISLRCQKYEVATIRDQKPLSELALRTCLEDGLSPSDWIKILNGRVFFWMTRERLLRLLAARAYRDKSHDVITVDMSTLAQAHEHDMELSPYNSGSTIMNPVRRGLRTFLPIADYPYEEWRRRRGRAKAIAEAAVLGGVPDISQHAVRVERMRGDKNPGNTLESVMPSRGEGQIRAGLVAAG